MEIPKLICTSFTLARMVWVRSDSTVSSIPLGIQDCNSGSTAFRLSTVSITLASDVLLIVSKIAGFCPNQAASRVFATPSITLATSCNRTTPVGVALITSGA